MGMLSAGFSQAMNVRLCILGVFIIYMLDLTEQQENIALGQPTFQSTVYEGGVPSNAVDGNKNTEFDAGSCTHTTDPENPWWAVDLGASQAIGLVEVTRRDDLGTRERFKCVHIGTTDVSPDVTPIVPGNFDVCVSHNPIVVNVTHSFSCNGYGRYLVIMQECPGIMNICEVEVFEKVLGDVSMHFLETGQRRMLGYITDTIDLQIPHQCARNCVRTSGCSSFNLKGLAASGFVCELNIATSDEQGLATFDSDPEWSFHPDRVNPYIPTQTPEED